MPRRFSRRKKHIRDPCHTKVKCLPIKSHGSSANWWLSSWRRFTWFKEPTTNSRLFISPIVNSHLKTIHLTLGPAGLLVVCLVLKPEGVGDVGCRYRSSTTWIQAFCKNSRNRTTISKACKVSVCPIWVPCHSWEVGGNHPSSPYVKRWWSACGELHVSASPYSWWDRDGCKPPHNTVEQDSEHEPEGISPMLASFHHLSWSYESSFFRFLMQLIFSYFTKLWPNSKGLCSY